MSTITWVIGMAFVGASAISIGLGWPTLSFSTFLICSQVWIAASLIIGKLEETQK